MDPRREQELLKHLPFALEPSVTLADALPIRLERGIGFTLLIAIYILLTLLPFVLLFWALWQAGDPAWAGVWGILARTCAWVWLGAGIWLGLWFLIYVPLDFKPASTAAPIPGMVEEKDDEELLAGQGG